MSFTLPARLIKSAMMCQASRDVRYYLNGILLEDSGVTATDGHKLYHAEWDKPIKLMKPTIVKINGTIPAKCEEVVLDLKTLTCKCIGTDKLLSIDTVDGRFPDWRRVVPDRITATESIGMSSDYLADIGKVFPKKGVELFLNGENNAMRIEPFINDNNEVMVIMPRRNTGKA